MSVKYDLLKDPTRKLFFHYAFMSTAGLMVLSIHIILDGIFIGNGIGSDGLAAINIAGVIFPFLNAIAFTIGFGAAAAVSVEFGEGNQEKANALFNQGFLLGACVALVYTIFCIFFIDKMVYLLGSNDNLFQGVKDYLLIFSLFSFFYVTVLIFEGAVRNDGEPKKAMISLIIGAVTNGILDYIFIFIFHWGLKGAAFATGIGQVVSFLYLIRHFVFCRGNLYFKIYRINKIDIMRILRNGMPNFISQISVTLVIIMGNWIVIDLIGELGVAAFSILLYVNEFMILGYAGVSEALQPLVSFNYGAKSYDRVKEVMRYSVHMSIIIGICMLVVSIVKPEIIIRLFNEEEALIKLASHAMRLFFMGVLFTGINMIYAAYFQAIEQSRASNIIQILRSFVFVFGALLLLPKLMGANGLWISVTVAESLTFIVTMTLIKFNAKKEN